MAAKTKKSAKGKKSTAEAATDVDPVEEDELVPVDENDDEDVDLEELDADVEDSGEGKKKSKVPEIEFGVQDLCKYLTEKTGREVKPRELRALIRKMAREDDPRVDREIVPGNRSRYDWPGGLKNPEVKRIIQAVTGGEMEADKQEKLAQLKADKAAKSAAKGSGKAKRKGKKGKKAKPAPEPEEIEDDDLDEVELDEDDD